MTVDCASRSAVVIGGSRGIGAAVTKFLCEAGAHVTFTYPPSEPPAEAELLAGSLAAAGGVVHGEKVDAIDPRATDELITRVARREETLDILVYNVGRNRECAITESTDDAWRQGLELNLGAAFYAVRPAIPPMIRSGYGKIILIGSSAAIDGGGGCPEYASAKAGLTGLMAYLCRTYARKGIRTNVVHPAVIDTELLRVRYSDAESRERLAAQIPVGRLGRPEDIAGIVLFLASACGDYVCGQEILADGGRTIFSR